MLEALIALAGNTAVAAATDAWEAARRKFAQLLGRGDPNKEQLVGRRLNDTCQQLGRVSDQELEKVQADLGKVWQVRIADLLEEDPGVEAELRALWRRSGRSCRPGWYWRRILRSRPGGMCGSCRTRPREIGPPTATPKRQICTETMAHLTALTAVHTWQEGGLLGWGAARG